MGINKGEIVFKMVEPTRTVYLLSKKNADKIVLNYKNEVPNTI
jgi:hypothetical protein